MCLRCSWSLSICLPAAPRSTGITPLPRYYGGSDFCRVPLSGSSPDRSPAFTRVLFPRPTATNHPGMPPPLFRVRAAECPARAGQTSPFRSQTRRCCRSRIVFTCHYGRSGSFPLLPTPPRGDAVTSSSHKPNGGLWLGSPTPEEDAAWQRTSAAVPGGTRRPMRRSGEKRPCAKNRSASVSSRPRTAAVVRCRAASSSGVGDPSHRPPLGL